MTNHMIVTKLPSNPNIFYAVLPMPSSPIVILGPIIEELSMKGTKDDRTLIFCRLYGDVTSLYQMMALELDSRGTLYISGKNRTSQYRLCDKYDACTALSVRKNIISSFTESGTNVIESLQLESVDLSEFVETESASPLSPKQLVPKIVRDVIRQDIERYHYELCLQSPEPNAAPIVELELSTVLLDRLISTIVNQCNEVRICGTRINRHGSAHGAYKYYFEYSYHTHLYLIMYISVLL